MAIVTKSLESEEYREQNDTVFIVIRHMYDPVDYGSGQEHGEVEHIEVVFRDLDGAEEYIESEFMSDERARLLEKKVEHTE